jgi:hypothetical protein
MEVVKLFVLALFGLVIHSNDDLRGLGNTETL